MLNNQYNTEAENKFLEHLMGLSYNRKCADCERANPSWADLTHSLFICYECSGLHRRLGAQRSRVKSTQMDSWSTEDLRRMYVGGNKHADRILQSSDFSIRYKDTDELIGYLDGKERESREKEPGDAFMRLTRSSAGVKQRPGVVEKKTRPKFSDVVESEENGDEDGDKAVRSTARESVGEVADEAEDERETLVLMKSSAKLKKSVNPSRSPFSFTAKEHKESVSGEE